MNILLGELLIISAIIAVLLFHIVRYVELTDKLRAEKAKKARRQK